MFMTAGDIFLTFCLFTLSNKVKLYDYFIMLKQSTGHVQVL